VADLSIFASSIWPAWLSFSIAFKALLDKIPHCQLFRIYLRMADYSFLKLRSMMTSRGLPRFDNKMHAHYFSLSLADKQTVNLSFLLIYLHYALIFILMNNYNIRN
jgi:hypothetical protein